MHFSLNCLMFFSIYGFWRMVFPSDGYVGWSWGAETKDEVSRGWNFDGRDVVFACRCYRWWLLSTHIGGFLSHGGTPKSSSQTILLLNPIVTWEIHHDFSETPLKNDCVHQGLKPTGACRRRALQRKNKRPRAALGAAGPELQPPEDCFGNI